MAIAINQITSGLGLRIDNEIYVVSEYNHVKPGKGSAFVRVKLKNLKTDLSLERTFKSNDTLEDVFLELRTLQFFYRAGHSFHFMDQNNYEELDFDTDQLGEDIVRYLQEGLNVAFVYCDHKYQKAMLPNFIITQIMETEPGFKGDTAKGVTKQAKIDTGAMVGVPLFINLGDWIKLDTRSGDYIERVQR